MKHDKKGFNLLTKDEGEKVQEIIDKNLKRITQIAREPSKFKIFVKTYREEGKNRETSIHLEIKLNNRTFEADASNWNPVQATKKAFEKVQNKMRHEFHLDESHHAQRKKPKSLQKPKDFRELQEEIKNDRI